MRICIRLYFIIVLALAACAAPMPNPTPQDTVVPPAMTPATPPLPTRTPTASPTASPSPLPTPSPFITAPASGQPGQIPILMYHHIKDLPAGATQRQLDWTVAPQNLDAQMSLLSQRGFHSITFEQLVGYLKDRKPLPAKPIIITFDDGWREDYTVAFPILTKYHLTGTFFVYTNPVGYGSYLTWDQLKDMTAAGMDVQSHSLSHPHLRSLSADAAEKEIEQSKKILEQRLGKPVIAFDYPSGEYNADIVDLVKRAGYECAVTLASGYRQRVEDLFTLHRIRVSYQDTIGAFSSRLP